MTTLNSTELSKANVTYNHELNGIKNHPSTPAMSGVALTNTATVTRKPRSRQQTVTVESQVSKEVNYVFDDVLKILDLNNREEELRRRIQRLFIEKEKEYAYKLSETEKNCEEELALTKLKLQSTTATVKKLNEFLESYKPPLTNFNSPQKVQNYTRCVSNSVNGSLNETLTPGSENNRTITPDAYADVVKERNLLRDELRELENSYSDLFKRYEKMRENCVLLKNAEELLKKNAEDNVAKYEKLCAMFGELRSTAANELNKANLELSRLEKQHEENTRNLRYRLKRSESELNTLTMTIDGKNCQIEELNKLCDELMRKAGIIDEEIASVADSFDDYD